MARSKPFALVISMAVHGAVFLGLYRVAFRQEARSRPFIIPEARLAAAPGSVAPQSTAPLELSRQPTPAPARQTDPSIEELPIAAVTLDDPPAVALPGDDWHDSSSPPGLPTLPTAGSYLAAGPVTSFFGQAGSAYKVVYVVDVSASLMIYTDDIFREMRRSIGGLVPTQWFHIVLARPGHVEEFAPRRLVPAIGGYKREAASFLGTITGVPQPGKADPIEAMKRAFTVHPELIYFLSDGDYPDVQADLLLTLSELNPHQEVKITVIGFAPGPKRRDLLGRIARQHGGHFRVVEPE